MKEKIKKLSRNVFVRNLLLIACAVIVMIFAVNISLKLFTRHNVYHKVPDLATLSMEQAQEAVREGKLRIEVNDSLYKPAYKPGVILNQMPEAGTDVKSGRRIFVTVNSARQKMVRVPYVTNISLRQAKNNLEVAGLEIARLEYRTDMATNYVLETRYDGKVIAPGSKIEAERGSGVTLVVGMTPEESVTQVPKIVGMTLAEAKSRLWELGLNFGKAVYDESVPLIEQDQARVWEQTPAYRSRVTLGTTVSMKLTDDHKKLEEGNKAADNNARRITASQREEEEE